jgi:hypothetical protein
VVGAPSPEAAMQLFLPSWFSFAVCLALLLGAGPAEGALILEGPLAIPVGQSGVAARPGMANGAATHVPQSRPSDREPTVDQLLEAQVPSDCSGTSGSPAGGVFGGQVAVLPSCGTVCHQEGVGWLWEEGQCFVPACVLDVPRAPPR